MTMKWLIWVLKICSEFQVLTLHFSEVYDLLYEHWAQIVEDKIIKLQSMSYVMTGLPQEYLSFFSDFDILL